MQHSWTTKKLQQCASQYPSQITEKSMYYSWFPNLLAMWATQKCSYMVPKICIAQTTFYTQSTKNTLSMFPYTEAWHMSMATETCAHIAISYNYSTKLAPDKNEFHRCQGNNVRTKMK